MRNPAVAAIERRRSDPCPPLQVANGTRAMVGPQVVSDAAAAVARAAWTPVTTGQEVPMIGERVYGDDMCDCEEAP